MGLPTTNCQFSESIKKHAAGNELKTEKEMVKMLEKVVIKSN